MKAASGVDASNTADIHCAKPLVVLPPLDLQKAVSGVDASNTADIHCAKPLVVLHPFRL
jgi:hypothetical protein